MPDQLSTTAKYAGVHSRHSVRWIALALVALAIQLGNPGNATAQDSTVPPAPDKSDVSAPPVIPRGAAGSLSGPMSPGIAGEFPIHRGDGLSVIVFGEPQLSCECAVGPTGKIILPLLKPVDAEGLTTTQLSELVATRLQEAGILRYPHVTVTIRSAPSSVVTVQGAVRNPQSVPVVGQARLLSVLSQAGGLADDAGDTAKIYSARFLPRSVGPHVGAGRESVTVNVNKLLDDSDPSQNVDVFPGDRVAVERAGMFYVLGEVNRPGGYNLKSADEQLTVLNALAIAGDLTSVAKRKHVVILRKDAKAAGARDEIKVNIKAVLNRREPDPKLVANDILYVPASGPKRAARAATGTVLGVAGGLTTGLVFYRR
jgi:polysaccharide biosynthesis/export protein